MARYIIGRGEGWGGLYISGGLHTNAHPAARHTTHQRPYLPISPEEARAPDLIYSEPGQPSGAEGIWPAAKANTLDQNQPWRKKGELSQSLGQVLMFALWFEGLWMDSI